MVQYILLITLQKLNTRVQGLFLWTTWSFLTFSVLFSGLSLVYRAFSSNCIFTKGVSV